MHYPPPSGQAQAARGAWPKQLAAMFLCDDACCWGGGATGPSEGRRPASPIPAKRRGWRQAFPPTVSSCLVAPGARTAKA